MTVELICGMMNRALKMYRRGVINEMEFYVKIAAIGASVAATATSEIEKIVNRQQAGEVPLSPSVLPTMAALNLEGEEPLTLQSVVWRSVDQG